MNSHLALQEEQATMTPAFEKWLAWYQKFSKNADVSPEWMKLFEDGTQLMMAGFEASLMEDPQAEFAFMICPFIQTVVGDRRPRWGDHIGYEAILAGLKKYFLGLVREYRFFPEGSRPGLWLLINYKNLEFFEMLAKHNLCHTSVATLETSPFNPCYGQEFGQVSTA